MRIRMLTVLASIALIGVVGVSSSTFGGRIDAKKGQAKNLAAPVVELKSYPKPPPVAPEPQKPIPILTVEPHPDTPSAYRDVHGKIARLITGNVDIVPPARIKSVEWLAGEGLVLKGWHGYIIDSTPIAGGRMVTLGVTPILYGPVAVSACVFEKYAVYNDGTIQFVGAIPADPNVPRVITFN
jgi:hypothetical protein